MPDIEKDINGLGERLNITEGKVERIDERSCRTEKDIEKVWASIEKLNSKVDRVVVQVSSITGGIAVICYLVGHFLK